jgi:hypothetical protein
MMLTYRTSLCGSMLSGASVEPTTQVRSSAMLVLRTYRKLRSSTLSVPEWHNVGTKLNLDQSRGAYTDRQTAVVTSIRIRFVHFVQRKHHKAFALYRNNGKLTQCIVIHAVMVKWRT